MLALSALAPGLALHAQPPAATRARAPSMQIKSPERTGSVTDMSSAMADMREQLAADEQTSALISALRGTNINDDDNAASGTTLQVVEMRAGDDSLPTEYDPVALEAYFKKRPGAVLTRVGQLALYGGAWAAKTIFSALRGELTSGSKGEVAAVAGLRNVLVSLGPFYIKLGQALSIRPDILSPQAMVQLQQLCDKVPPYDSAIAMQCVRDELGVADVSQVFSAITPEPVAAASLGQVYKATLRESGEEVAVKVQRPFVLETVSLDLHLARGAGQFLRAIDPENAKRIDVVSLLDEFAANFYRELDYELECANGIRIARDMRVLPRVKIPRNYPDVTTRRVHVAEWVDGEKLSQSTADDVGELVNLGVITYLTQLLDTGFFHADPHPGNMLRTPEGQLVILDFGLMTEVTDDQKYGMIEAIAHLINRDYSLIGEDFKNMDFIPRGVDTAPIVPALSKVFDVALAGGGAKSINFQACMHRSPCTRHAHAMPAPCTRHARARTRHAHAHATHTPRTRHTKSLHPRRSWRPTWRKSRTSSPFASLPTRRSSSAPSRSSRASRSWATHNSLSSTRLTRTSPRSCSPTTAHACARRCATWSTARARPSTSTASSTCCRRSRSLSPCVTRATARPTRSTACAAGSMWARRATRAAPRPSTPTATPRRAPRSTPTAPRASRASAKASATLAMRLRLPA